MSSSRSAPDGAPLFVVLNAGSGTGDAAARRDQLVRRLEAAGRDHSVAVVGPGGDVAAAAHTAASRARAHGGAVVAAGGDGTINAVAQAVLDTGCPFGILPSGTFNYFGRAHGLPTGLDEAIDALLAGRPQPVQAGLINDRVFLVNASVGLYPELLQDREAWKREYGRTRWVALFAALATLTRQHRPLRIVLETHGEERVVRTSTLFVGNNPLQLAAIGLPEADDVGDGRLAAVVVRPIGVAGMIGLALRGALGDLGSSGNVMRFPFERLTVRPSRLLRTTRMKVATDGEVVWMRPPLRFRIAPEPLRLILPVRDGGRA